jgi:hypothetical protein
MRGNLLSLGMLSGGSIRSKVIRDSDQKRYFEAGGLTVLTARLVSLSLHQDSWGAPPVNQHGRLFFGEGGSNLPHRVTFGLLAPGESPYGHVVLHHGAFLQRMPNGVCMIGTGCLEKLLEVMCRLPHLALEVTLSGGHDLLIGVPSLLVVIPLIAASSERNSLGPPLQPPFVTIGAPLCALTD